MSVDPSIVNFERRFAQIPRAVRRAVEQELERNAQEIVDEIRRLVPVRSGDLRESIGWTWGDAPRGAMVLGKVGNQEFGTLRVTIYAGGGDAFYGRFQEFGTVNMPANPFFYPVWRLRRRRTRTRLTRAMRKAITTAASS